MDLTEQEAQNVRAALKFLRVQCGGWKPLAKALRVTPKWLTCVANGGTVTPAIAFRGARLAGVGLDPFLDGKYVPHGVCPRCGYRVIEAPAQP